MVDVNRHVLISLERDCVAVDLVTLSKRILRLNVKVILVIACWCFMVIIMISMVTIGSHSSTGSDNHGGGFKNGNIGPGSS